MILLKCFSILGFAIPIIFDIFITIDWIIYSIAAYVLQAFFTIAKMNFYSSSSDAIFGIMNRVMLLSGIYALFRLGFSLITYMMDPDKLEPSKAGGKIIRNAVIAVIFLAASTFIFKNLNEFSNLFVSNGVVEKIVYGPNGTVDNYEESTAAKAFVNKIFVELFKSDRFDEENASNVTKRVLESVENGESSITSLSSYAYTSDFQYLPFLTAIVGIMLIFYFCSFTIEIGTRIFKLFILQILSPIPAILSIDPTQNKKLTEYIKVYIGIYISLFIRLITVYLVFAMIPFIRQSLSDISTTATLQLKATFLVRILLYISAFHAAKELPKLIDDAFGTKLGLGDAGKGFGVVLRGALAGTAGFAGGIVGGAMSGGLGGAVGGGLSGMWNGATKGAAAKNAVELAGIMGSNVKGSFLTGAHIAGAGGLGAFAVGGVENFFGGQRRDKATIANFDKDIESKEKMIQKTKNKLESSNHANGLRSNIENTLEKGFADEKGSLSDYMSRDGELSKLQEAVRINNDNLFYQKNPEYRQIDIDRVAERKAQLTEKYNLEKEGYIKNKMDTFSVDGSIPENNFDQSLKEMIKEYNDYVDENGYDNRKISGYDSYNDSKTQSEKAEREYQTEIAKYEKEKEEIENKKKAFVESANYKRRNKRNEENGSVWRKYRTSDSNTNDSGNTE